MIQEFSETLLKKLKDDLKTASNEEHQPHVALREQLFLVRESLLALRDFLDDHYFDDIQSEIFYHKVIYPQFKSFQVYFIERYALLTERPLTTGKGLKKYYLDELQYLERFFARHQFQYEYFRLGVTELDAIYFTVNDTSENGLPPVLDSQETTDATPMGHLFSKFIAFEKLREEILLLLRGLDAVPALSGVNINDKGKLQKPFKWTGEKVNLIELVHALFLKKQVNHGKMGIHEFFEGMGGLFDIDLGIPKRGFDDLKIRKRISKTNFLDGMKEGLLKKMEDEDAYDPEKIARRKLGF